MSASCRPLPSPRGARGFSFLEVMIALAMLLVGCLAILPMFAIGAQHLSQRRLATDLRRLKPEVLVLVQQEVDRSGGIPRNMGTQGRSTYPLSIRGYDVLVEWSPSPFEGPGVVALAAIRREGRVEHVLKPIAVLRSMFDTASTAPPSPAPTSGGARR
jgi:hypothetical protein